MMSPEHTAFMASESGAASRRMKELRDTYPDEMSADLPAYREKLGVRKELFDADWDSGAFRWSIHLPLELEEGKQYPLIYYSHGGNGTPLQAEFTGYSHLIAERKFIAVYPNNGGGSNECADTEFPRIMAALKEKGYPIDWSRIYAVGFSSGSDATETIGTLWPELVAAVAPCPGSNAMYNSLCRITEEAYEKCIPLKVPMICVGGTRDDGDAYPFPDQECFDNFNIWMEKISTGTSANFMMTTPIPSSALSWGKGSSTW